MIARRAWLLTAGASAVAAGGSTRYHEPIVTLVKVG